MACGQKIEPEEFSEKHYKGVSFVSPSKKFKNEAIRLPAQKLSANSLSIMPYAFVKEESGELLFDEQFQWWGEKKEGIAYILSEAQKNNYQIMLKPHIWRSGGAYTGKLVFTDSLVNQQFKRDLKDYLISYAEIAEKNKVEIFCIATEMKDFVIANPEFWKALIQDIRQIFKGKMTYAANWDEYQGFPFWSDLDFIGIDAYFPLSDQDHTTEKQMKTYLQQEEKLISRLQDSVNIPVLYTEYGYRSISNNAATPWESGKIENAQIDLQFQENALKCFYQTLWNKNYVAGGFLWKWFVEYSKVGGPNHSGFTVQNKPAEKIVKKYYEKL